ncbi:conserved hypothetical protein (plasmid) [Borreliella finlandensis]|uniref:Uncharacterized protein n=1 Tax=Borreliella finlandensis TaxID=498741 RepID=A0A806C7A7_9SPIR|nr:conserved hypothetical protein [Borreliella finlandensis]
MSNLAYITYSMESIKNEFLNIEFSEEVIDFIFLHNNNYNFEFLKEKIINVEKNLQKDVSNLDVKIYNVEKNLHTKIDSLDTKIDAVKSELNTRIDNVGKSLNEKLR